MPLLVPESSRMRVDREGGRRRREKMGERRKGEIITAVEQREPAPMTLDRDLDREEVMAAISPGMDEVEE
jgi:hypothetical protein